MIRHGGNLPKIERERGLCLDELLDFSANINPLGLPALFKSLIRENIEVLDHYPDYEYAQLKQALAEYYEIFPNQITLGNGAEELIHHLLAVSEGDVLIVDPTFSEYRVAAEKEGRRVKSYQLKEEKQFRLNLADLNSWLDQEGGQAGVLFLCWPNNPTSQLYPIDLVQKLAQDLNRRGIILALDESFIEFTTQASLIGSLSDHPNLFIIRSLTKIYALPGLRLGFAASSNLELIQRLEYYRGDWNVNSLADLCGQQINKLSSYRKKTIEYLAKERQRLEAALSACRHINHLPAAANFILIKSDRPDFYDLMLEKGIVLRPCQDFLGLSDRYFRLAVRRTEENIRLIQALQEVDQA